MEKSYKKQNISDWLLWNKYAVEYNGGTKEQFSIGKYNNLLKDKYKNIKFYIFEEDKPLGSGGCLVNLLKIKGKNFLLVYGDLIFNIDFKKFYKK